jgi:ABC-type polysaccharide/polyol phosphate transport system ATPase subunit
VVVSHDLDSIGTMCDRAVWLDHGAVRMDGATANVVQAYAAQWSEP